MCKVENSNCIFQNKNCVKNCLLNCILVSHKYYILYSIWELRQAIILSYIHSFFWIIIINIDCQPKNLKFCCQALRHQLHVIIYNQNVKRWDKQYEKKWIFKGIAKITWIINCHLFTVLAVFSNLLAYWLLNHNGNHSLRLPNR